MKYHVNNNSNNMTKAKEIKLMFHHNNYEKVYSLKFILYYYSLLLGS